MHSTVELVLMTASLFMMGIILFSVYGFRRERGIRFLIGIIVCRIVYSSSIILERSSDIFMEKMIFRNIQHTALNLIVPFIILFVYQLIGRGKPLKLCWKVLMFAVFSLWSLLVWFDPVLHVIFRTTELIEGHLVTTRTIYSMAFTAICYSFVALCIYFLFQYIRSIRIDFRKPGMWVLFLSTFPFMLEIAKFANPEWSSWLLPMSVYCGFLGTIMLFIMVRIKFFSTVPIARNIVLDTLQESIVIANASGKVVDSNQRAVEWFTELRHPAIYGRNIKELLAAWPEWQSLCKSMQQGRVEIDAWLNDERHIYSVNVYPLYTLGKGQGSISLIVDITEKQQHLEQIAQLNRLKDQLFTIVSHDIRSPLAMQYQLVELLEDDRERFSKIDQEIIENLGDQIRHTLGITNNLLEWFRVQREDMALRPQVLELAVIVEECCSMLQMRSHAKHISLKQTIDLGTLVNADREALGLILRNLLTNAIKFTGSGGYIKIEARQSGGMVVVSVRDNGVGMDEEQVRQLFDQKHLHSLEGTLGEKGTGLGLLVSRQFVERSGGSLWVESKRGQGSVFHFTLRGAQSDEGSHS